MAVGRVLPQQQPQLQFLNLQGTSSASLLNGSVLQRALLLQQLQGNLRSYNLATPNLTAPSLTPPQMATPNLQQFFPQATRQSLLGPPPVGVPINPSQLNLSGRNPQKQARTSSSTTPNRKVKEVTDAEHLLGPSSEEPTEQGPPGQLQAKVQPQTRLRAPKQTQTPELLSEPLEARVLPRFQPQVLQIQAQAQPQTQPQMLPLDAQVQPKLQKQAQTQTSPELLVPQQVRLQLQKEAEPPKQMQPQSHSQSPRQAQPQLQKQAQTQTYPQVQTEAQPRVRPLEQPPEQPPLWPPEPAQRQPQTQPQVSVPASEKTSVLVHSTVLETPPNMVEAGAALSSPDWVLPGTEDWAWIWCLRLYPPWASKSQLSAERVALRPEFFRAQVWGAGGSLKVTILQSSDSRAFSTVPLTPGPRPGDSTSATPAAASTPSKQALQFFCYICKANCSSQQEFQDHMSGAQHQQRLGEIQHMSQACLLSLLPVPRDVLEREDEEPPPRRWCNICQLYYMGDLIQHRRTQDHKIAKQSLRPFCTACNRYFKTPRKFVEHVKSQGHKDKAKELKMLEKEIAGQDEDHFITVDAVGCFEGDEEEEEDDDDEEDIEVEEEFCKQVRTRDISIEEWKDSETYSPNTAYGVDFLVPVMGYICRICHKFYHSNSGAQLSHCKSLAHFENLQKYKKAKNPSPTTRPVSRRCAINARNALTALFTSSGRTFTQPSTQDTAKTPSKVTAQPPQPQLPRRSSRLKS
ncbi:cip1-interacting zinc finger protein isoform 4 [Camelus ferus]|nr:cip1-interacting zinc finger protein isoform 4 [Camelus ferus]